MLSDTPPLTLWMKWKIDVEFFFHSFFLISSSQLVLVQPVFCFMLWWSHLFLLFFSSSVSSLHNAQKYLQKQLLDPFFSKKRSGGVGSMHGGADAVAFSQGDGCWEVYKATWWHLHKDEWMLLGQRERKEVVEKQRHGVITSSTLMLLDSHFAPPAV